MKLIQPKPSAEKNQKLPYKALQSISRDICVKNKVIEKIILFLRQKL